MCTGNITHTGLRSPDPSSPYRVAISTDISRPSIKAYRTVLTFVLTYLLTHLLNNLLAFLLTYLLTHLLNNLLTFLLTYLLTYSMEQTPSWESNLEALVILSLEDTFLRWGVVRPSPNPQAGGPPFASCPRLLIQYIRSYLPYWRPFLHPQPDDAPWRGDRDPLITEKRAMRFSKMTLHNLEENELVTR